MRQDERLLSYGEPQGEQEFREVLSEYIQKTRSVICSPDQILSLIHISSLLGIDWKKAFGAIVVGVCMASVIMYILSYVVIGGIFG